METGSGGKNPACDSDQTPILDPVGGYNHNQNPFERGDDGEAGNLIMYNPQNYPNHHISTKIIIRKTIPYLIAIVFASLILYHSPSHIDYYLFNRPSRPFLLSPNQSQNTRNTNQLDQQYSNSSHPDHRGDLFGSCKNASTSSNPDHQGVLFGSTSASSRPDRGDLSKPTKNASASSPPDRQGDLSSASKNASASSRRDHQDDLSGLAKNASALSPLDNQGDLSGPAKDASASSSPTDHQDDLPVLVKNASASSPTDHQGDISDPAKNASASSSPPNHQGDLPGPAKNAPASSSRPDHQGDLSDPAKNASGSSSPPNHQGDLPGPTKNAPASSSPPDHQGDLPVLAKNESASSPPDHQGDLSDPAKNSSASSSPPDHQGDLLVLVKNASASSPLDHKGDLPDPAKNASASSSHSDHQSGLPVLVKNASASSPPNHQGDLSGPSKNVSASSHPDNQDDFSGLAKNAYASYRNTSMAFTKKSLVFNTSSSMQDRKDVPTSPASSPPAEETEEAKLEQMLKKAATKSKTVVVTAVNAAWAEPGSLFDLLLVSLKNGNGTRKYIKHLVVIALDQPSYNRCSKIHPHCFALKTDGIDFSAHEAVYMKPDYLKLVWRKIDCMYSVLKLGYNAIFTDADVVWFRDPFLHFFDDADMQSSTDISKGVNVRPNTGFYYVKSNTRTIRFFEFWLRSRYTYGIKHDQQVFEILRVDPFVLGEIGIKIRLLDTAFYGGKCEPSKDLNLVCTMHANCCVGLRSKLKLLRKLLKEWKKYMALLNKAKRTKTQYTWPFPVNC